MKEYTHFASQRIQHLEMIQAVVSRLANEAALIRGWALTVAAAFYGYAAQAADWPVAAVGLLPVIAFWVLNAYYLRAERQYRSLYARVRSHDAAVVPFSMDARKEKVHSWLRTLWSSTIAVFYGMIFVVGIILVFSLLCNT
jgi:hypothetical protein